MVRDILSVEGGALVSSVHIWRARAMYLPSTLPSILLAIISAFISSGSHSNSLSHPFSLSPKADSDVYAMMLGGTSTVMIQTTHMR